MTKRSRLHYADAMPLFYILFLLVTVSSCSTGTAGKPAALGLTGDMYLVLDSAQWKGPLGRTLDSILTADTQGLPRPESVFGLHWVDPRKMNTKIKQRRNMMFVVTLDQNSRGSRIVRNMFSPQSIERMKSEPDIFFMTETDAYARGQEVIYLFSPSEKVLIQKIKERSQEIVNHFLKKERERTTKLIYRSGEQKAFAKEMWSMYGASVRIPFGYKLADERDDFVWFRLMNTRDDRNIFLARKKYNGPDDFKKENLIAFRNEICRTYLFGDPEKPETHLVTETSISFIPVTSNTLSIRGRYAADLRGLWKTFTPGMGGPFYGVAIADEKNQYLYYAEGFLYSPKKDQREIMRELEAIVHTIETLQDRDTPK